MSMGVQAIDIASASVRAALPLPAERLQHDNRPGRILSTAQPSLGFWNTRTDLPT